MQPAIEEQQACWDGWNSEFRFVEEGDYQKRQADVTLKVAGRLAGAAEIRMLDVGCGTGWLAHKMSQFGEVCATDLSPKACSHGAQLHPEVKFFPGSFDTVELPGPFDLVVSVDVIAHVADQQAFVDRIHSLLKPGGTFLLMTQNPFVWNRSSYLSAQRPGQIRNWPTLKSIRSLFGDRFVIRSATSICPGGDRGVLRLTGNRISRAALRRSALLNRLAEKCMIGMDMIIEAQADPGGFRP